MINARRACRLGQQGLGGHPVVAETCQIDQRRRQPRNFARARAHRPQQACGEGVWYRLARYRNRP